MLESKIARTYRPSTEAERYEELIERNYARVAAWRERLRRSDASDAALVRLKRVRRLPL